MEGRRFKILFHLFTFPLFTFSTFILIYSLNNVQYQDVCCFVVCVKFQPGRGGRGGVDLDGGLFRGAAVDVAGGIIDRESELIGAAGSDLDIGLDSDGAVAVRVMAIRAVAVTRGVQGGGVAIRVMTIRAVAVTGQAPAIREQVEHLASQRIIPVDCAGAAVAVQTGVVAGAIVSADSKLYGYYCRHSY